jgi:hypothetical protein
MIKANLHSVQIVRCSRTRLCDHPPWVRRFWLIKQATPEWIDGGIARHNRTLSRTGVHADRSRRWPDLRDPADCRSRHLAVRPGCTGCWEDCSASVLAPSWSLEHRRDGAGMRVVLDVGRAGVPDDGLSRTRLVKRPFQRCDSRVLTRQLDIETSETRRVQLIAKSSSTLQTLSAAAGPQGENWLLLPG